MLKPISSTLLALFIASSTYAAPAFNNDEKQVSETYMKTSIKHHKHSSLFDHLYTNLDFQSHNYEFPDEHLTLFNVHNKVLGIGVSSHKMISTNTSLERKATFYHGQGHLHHIDTFIIDMSQDEIADIEHRPLYYNTLQLKATLQHDILGSSHDGDHGFFTSLLYGMELDVKNIKHKQLGFSAAKITAPFGITLGSHLNADTHIDASASISGSLGSYFSDAFFGLGAKLKLAYQYEADPEHFFSLAPYTEIMVDNILSSTKNAGIEIAYHF